MKANQGSSWSKLAKLDIKFSHYIRCWLLVMWCSMIIDYTISARRDWNKRNHQYPRTIKTRPPVLRNAEGSFFCFWTYLLSYRHRELLLKYKKRNIGVWWKISRSHGDLLFLRGLVHFRNKRRRSWRTDACILHFSIMRSPETMVEAKELQHVHLLREKQWFARLDVWPFCFIYAAWTVVFLMGYLVDTNI